MVPGSRKKLDVALRREQVLKLDLAGYRDREIAEKLGVATHTVVNDLAITRKELAGRTTGATEERRAQALARLEDALVVATEVMRREHLAHGNGRLVIIEDETTGEVTHVKDDGPKLAAIDRLVKINESIRKLFGDDAPSKVETQIGGTVEYIIKVDGSEMEQL